MPINFGPGVSRTLDPVNRVFQNVVFQKGKPPLDSEFNLQDSIHNEQIRQQIAAAMPSGFVFDPTRAGEDYGFAKLNSNLFFFGQTNPAENDTPSIIANVNGWVLQVAGTEVASGVNNAVKMYPAPTSNNRIDFVFLEVWQALVAPNPATQNKPSASTIWKYGNVKHSGANLPDDLQDPTLGFETTKRVQVQYRIRVVGSGVNGVDLNTYPDGMDDPDVIGQGTASVPQAGFTYTNMGRTLGDPSLWRAGNGNSANALGTVDGYSYAIPICAVFRRNSSAFVAVTNAGAGNQNGGYNRRPTTNTLANPLNGAATLSEVRLNNGVPALSPTFTGVVNVVGLTGSGIDDPLHYAAGGTVFAVIDQEIIQISGIGPNQITIVTRGRNGTQATFHSNGTPISFFCARPDGKFADEVAPDDVLDLRRCVSPTGWDYNQLLTHNLAAVFRNRLRSTWKQSLQSISQGPVVTEVDYMYADAVPAIPPDANHVDGPDGIRTVFSDAATIQRDVTMMLNNNANLVNGFTNTQFDTNMVWEVGASFTPRGFVNNEGTAGFWTNGTVIFVYVEGATGNDGARQTFSWQPSTRAVRFLTPREYWKVGYPLASLENGDQYPVKMRFIGDAVAGATVPPAFAPPKVCLAHQPVTEGETQLDPNAVAKHPGPMYPWHQQEFLYPYVVLGDLLNSTLITGAARPVVSNLDSTRFAIEGVVEVDFGVNFDTLGTYYTVSNGNYDVAPSATLGQPLLNGTRTLFDLMTVGGTQRAGINSDVVLVMYGDSAAGSRPNNGAFLVVGAGTTAGKVAATGGQVTSNFTRWDASSSTRLVCVPLNQDFGSSFNTTTGGSVNMQLRSQISTAEGGSGTAGVSAMCIVLNDIGGKTNNPWNRDTLGRNAVSPLFDLSVDYSTGYARVAAKAVVSMALQYSPARGAQSHVPNTLNRFSLRVPQANYLRQAKGTVDPTFPARAGIPSDESFYNPVSIQLWNRLPAFGWDAGAVDPVTGTSTGISYGGNVVANTEQDRDSELFVDIGSKSIIFRPYRFKRMTLQGITVPHAPAPSFPSLVGSYNYSSTGSVKDGLDLFTQGGTLYPVLPATASGGMNMGFAVPPEYMPRFGRQDIPYYTDVATPKGSGTFLEGVNHLFLDTTDPTQTQTAIMGGKDNAGGNNIFSLYFRTNYAAFGDNYGDSGTSINGGALPIPYYDARIAPIDINPVGFGGAGLIEKFNRVTSSDLGSGLKGIQLPPYLGIARLYGVYEYNNFIAGGGNTWSADRATYVGNAFGVSNLLRKDADAQSLFIMQDGAIDLTEETGDHTYVVPSNVIDLTRIPGYAGQAFEAFEYVVECTVFGFAKNWINGNNYVLCRQHNGQAATFTDGQNPQPHLQNVGMVLPCAAHINAPTYSVIDRTVYQGDPYGTRDGTSPVTTDYQHVYGTVPLGSASLLNTPIQQFDLTTGAFIPQAYNPRSFEVLSSIDFYTTMGTGKIGGKLFPGTPLDIGYLQNTPETSTHLPPDGTSYSFRNTWDRTFSEGQKDLPNRAGILINTVTYPITLPNNLSYSNPEVLNGMSVTLTNISGQTTTKRGLISPVDFNRWAASVDINFPVAGQTTITTTREHGLLTGDQVDFVETNSGTFASTGLDGSRTILSVPNLRQFVILNTLVAADFTVNSFYSGQVALGNQTDDSVFAVASRSGSQLLTTTVEVDLPALGALAANAAFYADAGVAGARIGDAVTVNPAGGPTPLAPEISISASVSSDNFVVVRITNTSNVGYTFLSALTFYVTVTPRVIDAHTTMFNLANSVYNDPVASQSIFPYLPQGGESLLLQSTVAGTEGNRNKATVGYKPLGVGISLVGIGNPTTLTATVPLSVLAPNFNPTIGSTSIVYLSGFGGAGAAAVNNRFWVATVTGANTFTIPFDSTAAALTVVAPSGASSGSMAFPQIQSSGGANSYSITAELNRVWLADPNNNNWLSSNSIRTSSNFVGGVDIPVNAGNGNSQLSLTGMTERLPMGILLHDSYFMAENPLNDAASAVQTFPSALRPIQKLLPLTDSGREYDRFLGAPGDLIAQGDGSILRYTPYTVATPAGTRGYRMYRGGGSLFVLDGPNPGGPVDFAVTSFPPAIRPVLKGGVLVGKAMLVRNFPESPSSFAPARVNSYGDEIQMLVVTTGVFGSTMTTQDGITLEGTIGTAGYGEGYSASDRYRIDGKPMFRDFTFRHPNPANVQPTPYIKGLE